MAAPIAAAIAADAVGVRLFQHQTGSIGLDRDRIPALVADELRRVLIGQVLADGNNRPARSRCFLRGHADACAIVQCATDGDELIIEQMHIVGGGALLVVLDDRRAGHGKVAMEHMHAAAVVRRRVARDLAAAHVECTCLHTHAAAAARLVVAADLAAAHGEGAAEITVHTHAAAAVARRVARDLAAAHGERAIVHIHAAAVFRLVAADLAAGHIECALFSAVVAHVHAAAPVLAAVFDDLVVSDAAAVVQIKRAARHIHAAAVAFAAAVYLRRVVRDAAAAHMKRAAAHVHAAAVAGSLGTARRRVVRDLAAVHINRAAGDLHAAALGRLVFSDAAAVQIECAAVDLHAAAFVGARDLARTAAIRQGQRTGYDLKHGLIFGCALDRLAVQADGDGAFDLNGMIDLNILTRFQIIVAAAQNIILTVN